MNDPENLPMKPALKLHADKGGPDGFDQTAGEPSGWHRTLLELDPCPDGLLGLLDKPLQELVDDMDAGSTVADAVNLVLGMIDPLKALPEWARHVLDALAEQDGPGRLVLRKMAGDGRS